MTTLRRLVVFALLAVWSFPAVSSAKPLAEPSAQVAPRPASGAPSPVSEEQSSLAAREKQAQDLEAFRGGGVSIYIGSGALLVVVIVLLIILL